MNKASEFVIGLLFAAHKNLAICSAQVICFLLENDAYRQRVLEELREQGADGDLPVLENALEETLRVCGHALGAIRKVEQYPHFELTLRTGKRYKLPPGYYVSVPHAAIARDPRVWSNPDTWDPDRFSPERNEGASIKFAHVAFSGGHHACPGRQFAYRAIRALLTEFLSTYDVSSTAPMPPLSFSKATLAQRAGVVKVTVQQRRDS